MRIHELISNNSLSLLQTRIHDKFNIITGVSKDQIVLNNQWYNTAAVHIFKRWKEYQEVLALQTSPLSTMDRVIMVQPVADYDRHRPCRHYNIGNGAFQWLHALRNHYLMSRLLVLSSLLVGFRTFKPKWTSVFVHGTVTTMSILVTKARFSSVSPLLLMSYIREQSDVTLVH